ncbi:hypothetical protein D1610_06520 [Sphingomonas gilva]|uniref:Transferrin-binding protein B C-lobe/N-lobe beta-barrel domain-containing protein n=1 Tax=Sphingomonas gilva TaxID=2305907 RepID=A0A396RNQ8_9SPHN|nr:transferrin-binding protein-like solute binding protein [Sphingomonas gilva]RHW18134.1 hypothetical protein D1610_06520 [Sphingomonas gilva]
MKTARLWPAIAACTLLAACGGGSTSGGGGIGSTPTPTPGPTPGPTPTNTSLADLQYSENFTNDAASGSGTIRKSDGGGSATAARSTVTVRYDAAARSYTITSGSRSQTFAPADRSASDSSAFFDVYYRTNGSTQDALSLTRPGSSGPLTYNYVGSGFWQRVSENSSSYTLGVDAFTYGVETPDAAMPRSGGAVYSIDLIGSSGLTTYSGAGSLSADFASSRLSMDVDFQEILDGGVVNPFLYDFSASAQIGGANRFEGTFRTNVFEQFSGQLNGRFYGPAAEEVGATFVGSGDYGSVIVGTITGRQDNTLPGRNQTLVDLVFSENFSTQFASFHYVLDSDGVIVRADRFGTSRLELGYDVQTDGYTLTGSFDNIDQFHPSSRVESKSNNLFTVYETVQGDRTNRLTMYNPGGGNDELALSYASFGRWEQIEPENGLPTAEFTREAAFVYGVRTAVDQMPRTGNAHFEGVAYGIANQPEAGGTLWDITGTSRFDVSFQSQGFTGSLNLAGTARNTGNPRDFGTYVIDDGRISSGAMSAAIMRNDQVLGGFHGNLYGPDASEIAGAFSFQTPLNNEVTAPYQLHYFSGIAVAKRTP